MQTDAVSRQVSERNQLRTTKFLVTGANGFVGRALCKALRQGGAETVVAVRVRRQPDEVALGDLSAATDWRQALARVDVVVHLAARVHVMNDTVSDRLAAFRSVNVDATLNLARQAAQCGVRRFVFISSIGVNGAATTAAPFSELSAPRPHSDYALSKLEAEEGLRKLCAETGMEFVIIRPPLVYGADAPGNFHSLLKLVRRRLPMPLGSVRNQRSMVALDNLVDFVIVCSAAPAAANELFLVADQTDVSTPELIRLLGQGMDRPARMLPVPVALLAAGARMAGKGNAFQQLCGSLRLDTGKARQLLGWRAPVHAHEGLRKAAAGFLKDK